MKIRRSLFRAARPFLNIRQWAQVDYLKRSGKNIYGLARGLVTPGKAARGESFDAAMSRLKIDEKAVRNRQRQSFVLALVFFIVGILLLAYAVMRAYRGHIISTLISFVIAGVSFAESFRNHFWYVQIKERRLGLTFNEWWNYIRGKGRR